MGGENLDGAAEATPFTGSSPHGRGKPVETVGEVLDPGLIPAWAGKTSEPPASPEALASHPRMGGENLEIGCVGHGASGSSPRGRGIIPARAGKTTRTSATACVDRAHPRAGGENTGEIEAAVREAGSSPRERGKLFGEGLAVPVQGIIPA